MPEQLWITALLNKYFAGVANAILGIFHLHAHYPQAPIPNYVAMQLLVFVLIVLFFVIVRARLSVDEPRQYAAPDGGDRFVHQPSRATK